MSITEHCQLHVRRSKLSGVVELDGAKNSALRLLAASLLTSEPIILTSYPAELLDACIHVEMIEKLGKKCSIHANTIKISEISPIRESLEWHKRSIRNTLLILGALVSRNGIGKVPLPGGCKLGERKFDIHIMLLESLGAIVWQEDNYLCAKAPVGGLKGSEIHLPLRSTGATENAVIAASLAKGTTRIWNPHIRPEILDLISMLRKMGAQINVYGQEHIEVVGVNRLTGSIHNVMPDNMEAITWLIAAALSGGDVEILNFPSSDLQVLLTHLSAAGARLFFSERSLIVRDCQPYPLEISTGPHPGINSDVQPLLASWASACQGESRIIDLRFPGRYSYAKEMGKMGLEFQINGDMLLINGKKGGLVGTEVFAHDLRAGAALALCGLIADGTTRIHDAWQIKRGYVRFVEKLQNLGGDVSWKY